MGLGFPTRHEARCNESASEPRVEFHTQLFAA
jgi:hypothetical protein